MARIPSVFVIDQDRDLRFQLQRLIQEAEFAGGGHAGLGTEGVSAASEARPDIVLCALREPVARSVQTVESLVHSLPYTPVIVYSTSDELEDVRRAMVAGARDFLRAPFDADELRRALTAALESEERRRLRMAGTGALGPQGTVITVFGAKGGTGKTTIATNLAVAFARAGQSTALVDADETFGDAGSSLGLAAERSVTDALRELDGLEGEPLRKCFTLHESGLMVLTAPATPFDWDGVSGDRLRQLLQAVARQFDVVVVDTASTLSPLTLATLQSASLILWVTTPDYASVHDSLLAMRAARSVNLLDDRLRVLLNAVSPETDVRQRSIEEALGCPVFWTVSYDRALQRSVQLGRAAVAAEPDSQAAASLNDLARVLGGGSQPEAQADGALRRLLDRFKLDGGGSRRSQEQQLRGGAQP